MYKNYIKRPIDFLVSLFLLIFLLPLLVILAILVRFKLGSPILFKQQRPGKDEKVFSMYKFRTMTNEKDSFGKLLPDSLRLTKFGRILRSTSLDELPELVNILKGEMSLIGPRPLLIEYLPYYTSEEKIRHSVRPGITGLAQISGRNYLDWDKRFEKDIEYVKNISFCLDMKVIFKTIYKLFSKEDIAENTNAIEGNLAEIRSQNINH